MNFPSDKETFNIFNNLFVFFGTLDLQGYINNLHGKNLQNIFTNTQNLATKKISEIFLEHNLSTKTDGLEKAVADAAENESSLNLNIKAGAGANISVQMFFCPVIDEANDTKRIFFCAREIVCEKGENYAVDFSKTGEDVNRTVQAEIEKAVREKDFFLAFVSHELRSPLNTILGWAKILLTKEVNEAARKNALETIEKNARLQAKLIDDLVDSAKLSSGKLGLELVETNLYEILESVYVSQKSAADAKKVSLEFAFDKENVSICADSSRLRQMITILISNALKTTGSGGYIKVNLETNDAEAIIAVRDNGQGISRESLSDVFDQFRRSDENKSFNSNALGLSIVKILAEKHNGRVRAESAGLGFGSTFEVILPLIGAETTSGSKAGTFVDE